MVALLCTAYAVSERRVCRTVRCARADHNASDSHCGWYNHRGQVIPDPCDLRFGFPWKLKSQGLQKVQIGEYSAESSSATYAKGTAAPCTPLVLPEPIESQTYAADRGTQEIGIPS